MDLQTPQTVAGAMPQDVVGKAGKNAIFIVYKLLNEQKTEDQIKDVCSSFSAMIRSMQNRFPDSGFSAVIGFGADAWNTYIGFVDGTENPSIDLDPYSFAVIGKDDPDFAGGSYVFVQKYIHDMNSWNATPVGEQEKVIGRHKYNDVELSDEEKPMNAHNAVTNIQDDKGNDLKIIRGNMPFSNTSRGEYGTCFIGYASTFATTRKMLENMFVGSPKGNTDRLLDFSTAVTGTLFFAPSYNLLAAIGG